MSVILYKLNESGGIDSSKFDVKRFRNAINSGGWFLTEDEAIDSIKTEDVGDKEDGMQEEIEAEEEEKKEILEEAEEDKTLAGMDNDEIRLAAKKADIEKWDTKRITTLIKELDEM